MGNYVGINDTRLKYIFTIYRNQLNPVGTIGQITRKIKYFQQFIFVRWCICNVNHRNIVYRIAFSNDRIRDKIKRRGYTKNPAFTHSVHGMNGNYGLSMIYKIKIFRNKKSLWSSISENGKEKKRKSV